MPKEPLPAAKWMVERLLKELTQCKMYPVILGGMKHQEKLCSLFMCMHCIYRTCELGTSMGSQGDTMKAHAQELEASYFKLREFTDQDRLEVSVFATLSSGIKRCSCEGVFIYEIIDAG